MPLRIPAREIPARERWQQQSEGANREIVSILTGPYLCMVATKGPDSTRGLAREPPTRGR
jgi:hypothetical protein